MSSSVAEACGDPPFPELKQLPHSRKVLVLKLIGPINEGRKAAMVWHSNWRASMARNSQMPFRKVAATEHGADLGLGSLGSR